MNLLLLSLIGSVEAVVYLVRYRTAHHRSAWVSAWSTFTVATMRILFVVVGAASMMKGEAWWALVAAYAIPATVATLVAHGWMERRRASDHREADMATYTEGELVKRLRTRAGQTRAWTDQRVMDAAADEIERLESQVSHLTAAVGTNDETVWKAAIDAAMEQTERYKAEIARLTAERRS